MKPNGPDDFWNKCERHASGCWIWTASRSSKGYGRARYHGALWPAHRLAVVLSGVTIPAGMCVCHHCDNASCINPAHLFVGTAHDNNRDRDHKGRTARGDKHGSRTHLNVSHTAVGAVLRDESWKHI